MTGGTWALGDKLSEHNIGEMTFEAADRVTLRLTLGSPSLNIGPSTWLESSLNHCNRVDRPVQPTVAAAVQSVSLVSAR